MRSINPKTTFLVLAALVILSLVPTQSSHADSIDVFCKPSSAVARSATKITQPGIVSSSFPPAITLKTNCGDITIQLNAKYAPITTSSLLALINGSYYDNSSCYRLTTSGIFIIQCGVSYTVPDGWVGYADENLPISKDNNYPAGTVAMANYGPKTNGSEFFFAYKDTILPPSYSIWGKVIAGLSILNYVSAQGTNQGTDGTPKQSLSIERIIVRDDEWFRAYSDGATESFREYEKKLSNLSNLPAQNEKLKEQINNYLATSKNQLAQITLLQSRLKSLEGKVKKICSAKSKPKGC
jgi:peptidyl-prolyl cis-trans isomerase B (cyclophilin B)